MGVAIPCVLGAETPDAGACFDGSACTPIGGYCRDPNSSIDDGGVAGRLLSVAQVVQILNEASSDNATLAARDFIVGIRAAIDSKE